jgi:hypothetical protein
MASCWHHTGTNLGVRTAQASKLFAGHKLNFSFGGLCAACSNCYEQSIVCSLWRYRFFCTRSLGYMCCIISSDPLFCCGCWSGYIAFSDHAGGEKRLGLFEIELRKRDHFIDFTLPGRLLSEAKGRCTALRSIRNLSEPNPGVTRERFPPSKVYLLLSSILDCNKGNGRHYVPHYALRVWTAVYYWMWHRLYW